jgi:two-component system sensor histidine kinase UhpB
MKYSLKNTIVGYIAVLSIVLLVIFNIYSTLVSQKNEQQRIDQARAALLGLEQFATNSRDLQINLYQYSFSPGKIVEQKIKSSIEQIQSDSARLLDFSVTHPGNENVFRELSRISGNIANLASAFGDKAKNTTDTVTPEDLEKLNPIQNHYRSLIETVENEYRIQLGNAYAESMRVTQSSFTFVRVTLAALLALLLLLSVFFYKDSRNKKNKESMLELSNKMLGKKVNDQYNQLSLEKNLSDSVINSMPGVFFVQDTRGRYLRWNKELERISEYDSKEMAEINALDFFEKKDHSAIIESQKKVFQQGFTQVEATAITKSGKKIPFYFTGQLIQFEGKPCIIGTGIDITERKKVESENERMRALLNERVKELTTLYRTSQILQTEGRPFSELLKEIVELLPAGWQHSDITAARIKLGEEEFKTRNYGQGPHHQTAKFITPDGQEGLVEIVYLKQRPIIEEDAFYIEERNLINMIAEMIRVSLARKHEREELKKSEANLHTIFDTTDTIYFLLDNNFRVISYNQRAYDFTRKELHKELPEIKEQFMKYFSPDQVSILGDWLKKAVPGDQVMYEVSYPQTSELSSWYYVRMFPITGKEQKIFGLMLAISDITEKKLLEQEIIDREVQAQKKTIRAVLNAQEKERNKIGQELHDNVNQILASTKLYLTMAIADHPNNLHFLREAQGFIESAIAEIRVLSAKEVSPLRDINLRELIHSLLESLRYNSQIAPEFVYQIPQSVHIEEELKLNIYRIIQEQINNILKHSKATACSIKLSFTNDQLELYIRDNGIGFDTSKSRKGIGISNMINRVESFNGELSINSSPGNGCITEIRIPLKQA